MPVGVSAPEPQQDDLRLNPASHPASKTALPISLTGQLTEVALACQRRLEQVPNDCEALLAISLVALASRQTRAAVTVAQAAVAASPHSAIAWTTLKADARMEEAESAYAQAIRLNASHPLAHMGLGELLIAAGRPGDAVREFELVLKQQPTFTAAHMGLGSAFAFLARNGDALASYEQALALKPDLAEAHFAAGFALAKLARMKQAETRYRRALTLRPDFAAAWVNLGSLLREQGQDLYAEAALKRAVELRPDLVSGWVNLAVLERERKRHELVEKYLNKAFELNPAQVETLISLCQFRAAENDLPTAWQWLRRAQAVKPDHDEAANMEGILLHAEERFEEAVKAFARAERLGNLGAASNRGNSLLDLGRMDEALRAHEVAVERDSAHPGAKYNLALTQLRLGHWERGWAEYEARWSFREVHRVPRRFKQPRWSGDALDGRRILLHAEQGLGDTIQFSRYAALVASRGGRPILAVQAPVERLMRSLAVVRAGLAEVEVLGRPFSTIDFDFECPMMSLPAVFHTKVETVPWPGAYLGVEDTDSVLKKRRQFPSLHSGLRIGLDWAGNPRYKADKNRSMRLETLLPLVRSVDANWISLQKGEGAEAQLAE